MFNFFTGLFPKSSKAWDTSCARKYLKISDEELKKLDNIPGWSTRKRSSNDTIAEQRNSVSTNKGPLTTSLSLVNPESTVSPRRSTQKAITTDIIVEKSVLPPKKKAKLTPSLNKHSKTLQSNNKRNSSISANSSTSLPDIDLLDKEPSKSVSEGISRKMSSAPALFYKTPVEKSVLDTTYAVSSVLEDKTNDMEIISDVQNQNIPSLPEASTKKRTIENSGAESSSEIVPEENVPKFGELPVFPLSAPGGHASFLNKKLRLLEKRFSPSKDFTLTSSQEAAMAQVNLSNIEIQNNLSKPVPNLSKVSCSQTSFHSQANLEVSQIALTNSQKAITKDKTVSNELSKKEYAEIASQKSKDNVFEEEIFVSRPIPCGQPLPSNPSPSTIQSHVVEPIVKPSIANTTSEATIVPLGVSHEKVLVQEIASQKSVKTGRKKKLKSKGESSSRKTTSAKSVVSVQYTPEQIRKMIEMLNYFLPDM